MAGIIQAGYIARPGEDIFPTTGPHLDVRVRKAGQYIDPSTWRSGLQNLLVGEKKVPLYQATKDGFKPGFTVTSGYGPRNAPVAGASTFHKGIDFGIAGGTPLYWRGAGAFKPGKGLGTITTPEGYEIELLHTKGGAAAKLAGAEQASQQSPQVPPPQQPALADAPQSINILIDTGGKEDDEERITPQDQLKKFISETFKSRSQSSVNPMSMAQSLMSMPTKNYFA